MRKIAVGLIGGAMALATTAASAATLNINEAALMACNGLSSCAVTGATITGSPRALEGKTVAGQFGLGVKGGRTGGEIDAGELLGIKFASPVVLESFKIAFLFNGPEFNDRNEKGLMSVTTSLGEVLKFSFQAVAENVANFSSGLGSVTNCGVTTAAGSGCFLFGNRPLGDIFITEIAFTGTNVGTVFNKSDFALAGFSASEVPIPGAFLLLLSGLCGFAFAKRRRMAIA